MVKVVALNGGDWLVIRTAGRDDPVTLGRYRDESEARAAAARFEAGDA